MGVWDSFLAYIDNYLTFVFGKPFGKERECLFPVQVEEVKKLHLISQPFSPVFSLLYHFFFLKNIIVL